MLDKILEINEMYFKDVFKNNDAVLYRYVSNEDAQFKGLLIFLDGLVNADTINSSIIRPILSAKKIGNLENLQNGVIFACETAIIEDVQAIIYAILSGNCILIVEGSTKALDIDTKGFNSRSVAEPDSEKVLNGSKEGFNEVLMTNISLLRRRVQNSDLKLEMMYLNTSSHQQICLAYIENNADQSLIDDIKRRIKKAQIHDTFDANTLNEHIKDHPASIFPTIGMSERVDIVASKLNEGRVCVFVDGTCNVLWAPFIFQEGFHAPDDYYLNFYYASLSRIIRYVGFFIAILFPAIYLSIMLFHKEILPLNVLSALVSDHSRVPFSITMEAFVLIILFELLKEATMRGPNQLSQTLGIVSAIVFGDAAVKANLISSPMLIVTAFSSLCSIMNPRFISTILILKLGFVVIASLMGFYGLVFAILLLYIYLYSINSFNTPYMSTIRTKKGLDTIIRVPAFLFKHHDKN